VRRHLLDPLLRVSIRSRRVRRVALFAATGAASGLLAVGYSFVLDLLTRLAQGDLLGLAVGPDQPLGGLARPWLLPVMTTLVGLLTGWLMGQVFHVPGNPAGPGGGTDKARGVTDGTDAMIRAFHRDGGRIRPLSAVLRTGTSILTMASGGSAGKEGPVAFMGAGFGSWLSELLGLSARDRRALLLAGAAGGLGAIFRSPLGAAMTAVEVLYSDDFEGEALLPAIISSVCAYMVFTLFNGTEPIIAVPDLSPLSLGEIPFYLLLSLACAGSAWLYVKGFFFIKYTWFQNLRQRLGPVLATGLGGLAMGLAGMACPAITGSSHASLELAALGQVPALALLLLLLGKIAATSFTIGSGFSGGMFAPGLFVGGVTGGLVAKLCQAIRPEAPLNQGSFVLVGMGAFFACAAKAPIGPLIMVCEISQGYALLAPLLLCSAVALSISGKFCLYENQLPSQAHSPAHRDEVAEAALKQRTVGDAYVPGDAVVLEEGTTLAALSDILTGTKATAFAVRGARGEITGLLDVRDARGVIFDSGLHNLVVVRDLARPPVVLSPDLDLHRALVAFARAGTDQLPVVDPQDPTRVLGSLSLRDIMTVPSSS
jgi:CIC family chloride channel protein